MEGDYGSPPIYPKAPSSASHCRQTQKICRIDRPPLRHPSARVLPIAARADAAAQELAPQAPTWSGGVRSLTAQTPALTFLAIGGFQPRSTALATLFYAVPTEVQLCVCLCARKLTKPMCHPHPRRSEEVMKMLITTAAFALRAVGPALAQPYNPEVGSGNIVPPVIASGPWSTPQAIVRKRWSWIAGDGPQSPSRPCRPVHSAAAAREIRKRRLVRPCIPQRTESHSLTQGRENGRHAFDR